MDLDGIKAVLALLDGTDVSELEYEDESVRIAVRRGAPAPAAVAGYVPMPAPAQVVSTPAAASASAPASSARGTRITSPFVGTLYRAASPDSPPFTDIGQRVSRGQTLCIVEAMKLMNEIESEVSGTVREILVANGQPVEYGQALFVIEPD